MFGKSKKSNYDKFNKLEINKADIHHKISAMIKLLGDLHGSEQLIRRADKFGALNLMRSASISEKIVALERIVYGDPTIAKEYTEAEVGLALSKLEEKIIDIMARKSVEEELENKVILTMQQRQNQYFRELKEQLIKEEVGPDNAQTLKKYVELEMLEEKQLSNSAMEQMRPKGLSQVVGQEKSIKSLVAKLSSPFPQHIIIYGPPGVGKTTAARLALDYAKQRQYTPFATDAPFVEVDGTTLRWDPREVTNPLLGSVHDPIYQGAKKDLADGAIPEPKLGLVTKAHGGVLFIDEIGELEPLLQNKLLKVLEDKRVMFDSAYYDPEDPQVPKYIKKLFSKGAPADFVLIGATTKDPEEINPALRSRCAEIFFDPLSAEEIQAIVDGAASRLSIKPIPEISSEIAKYTIEGRQAVRLLADAYSNALFRLYEKEKDFSTSEPVQEGDIKDVAITMEDLLEVIHAARLTPYNHIKASLNKETGRVFGLGVSGFLGSIIEIEAVAFPASQVGKGTVRFNDTAGSMAKDSVFNAASVFRSLTGKELTNYDIHVNIIGGGRIDGPSAGAAIFLAIYSAVEGVGLPQNLAITGEISLRGKIKPVGGIQEKIFGAQRAGMEKVFIPSQNKFGLNNRMNGIQIVPVESIEELIEKLYPSEAKREVG